MNLTAFRRAQEHIQASNAAARQRAFTSESEPVDEADERVSAADEEA